MDWRLGFSAKYYATLVDPDTWKDQGRFEITGGTINHTLDALMESADISCVDYNQTNEQWIRIWMETKQRGESTRLPLFTGIATSPSRNIQGRLVSNSLQCYSVLQPAQDILLPRGWYAPVDMDAGKLLMDLLSVTHAPISITETTKTLSSAIIAQSGETNLTMATQILDAVNWRLKIGGDGSITIGPYVRQTSATFDNLKYDVLEPSIQVNFDWYSCPNVFRVVIGDAYAIAVDDNPNSIFSTVSRGREVWAEESQASVNDKETASEYATRRLKELQSVSTTVTYDRRFSPGVYVGDLVRLNYPAQNLTGVYLVTSQSITLGYNCKTNEEAYLYEY